MSAQWRGDPNVAGTAASLPTMTTAHLDAVMAIENAAYAFPWSRGNFIDSLAAGYFARVLCTPRGEVIGYFVAMAGVDEMHLLNLTVAPAVQRRGHARTLLGALGALCRRQRAAALWLEVRASNARAQAIYLHAGFTRVGLRKGYYPAPFARREDAIVMSLRFEGVGEPPVSGANDALG
jgi:ribosomal-protein-alanine N-acetyltransferase